uniref:TRF2/HOY1 PH-like domain-containing protein n=1 Tax=Kalanchoe fedtschenkoi TaxID=63787 RepID=A0A7N0VJ48_KALFE
MEGEGRQGGCWFNAQQDGAYDGAVKFNDNLFFHYSPMVLESSCFDFDRSEPEVDHSELTRQQASPSYLQESTPSSSPLGLTLRKTPSLLTMFESKLFKEDRMSRHHRAAGEKTDIPQSSKLNDLSCEKLKASNFGACFLKIGKWQRVKRFEGDLVAKCYFAKKKLVWEVLEGALKSKIEMQWCDIMGIRAQVQDPYQPGILEIELSQPPMFYHESDPKPRKHTCWQPCPDFTGGQALAIRRHYVTFPPGTLDRHYKKLLQCDKRLSELSQRPFPTLNSPYFPSHYSDCFSTGFSFEPDGFTSQGLMNYAHHSAAAQLVPSFIIPSHATPAKPSATVINESSRTTFSDCYNMYNHEYDGSLETATQWKSDHRTAELQTQSGSNPGAIYDDIEKHLLNDSQFAVSLDERALLAKVSSLCSLLDSSTQPADSFSSSSARYMEEAEYQTSCYSGAMDVCISDELNRFGYAQQHATLGSCSCPYPYY